jgi:hypothetical protein
MKKNLLLEIDRINSLMGLQLITEGIIPNALKKIFDEIGSISPNNTPRWLTSEVDNAATNIKNYYRNLQNPLDENLMDILDDFYELASAKNEWRIELNNFFLKNTKLESTYRTFNQILSEKLNQMDLTVLSESEVYDRLLKELLVEYPIRLQAAGGTVPPNIDKFVELAFSEKAAKELYDLQKVAQVSKKVVQVSSTYWTKWFEFNKEKFADQIRADVAALADAKAGKSSLTTTASDALKQRIFENMRHLYRAGKDAYKKLTDDLQTIIDGTTNTKNKEFYKEVLDLVKRKTGDWELIEEVSMLNPTWKKYWKEISESLKSGYAIERAILKIPMTVKQVYKNLLSILKTGKPIAEVVKPEYEQAAWKAFANWFLTFSPRGIPVGTNLKNYEEIVKLSGQFPGAIRSYVLEVAIRASKTSGWLAILYGIYNVFISWRRSFNTWFYKGVTNTKEAEKCLTDLSAKILTNKMDLDETVKFINDGKHPCIFTFGYNEEQISEIIIMAMWLSKVDFLGDFILELANNFYKRLYDDYRLGGPPVVQIFPLFEKFTKEGLGPTIQESLPKVVIPTQNPAVTPTTTRVGPTPTQTPTTGRNTDN